MSKDKEEIRLRILREAIDLFSKKSYHGTSMRQIATAASCSLPMLYYYYDNKERLYHAIAYESFTALIERLNETVERGRTLAGTYANAIIQRKMLSEEDHAIYRLALKTWLGFDGDSETRSALMAWEKEREQRTHQLFQRAYGDMPDLALFARTLVRVVEHMIERIILPGEEIPDTEIEREIELIVRGFKGGENDCGSKTENAADGVCWRTGRRHPAVRSAGCVGICRSREAGGTTRQRKHARSTDGDQRSRGSVHQLERALRLRRLAGREERRRRLHGGGKPVYTQWYGKKDGCREPLPHVLP